MMLDGRVLKKSHSFGRTTINIKILFSTTNLYAYSFVFFLSLTRQNRFYDCRGLEMREYKTRVKIYFIFRSNKLSRNAKINKRLSDV